MTVFGIKHGRTSAAPAIATSTSIGSSSSSSSGTKVVLGVCCSTKVFLVMALTLMSIYVAILYHQMLWSEQHDHQDTLLRENNVDLQHPLYRRNNNNNQGLSPMNHHHRLNNNPNHHQLQHRDDYHEKATNQRHPVHPTTEHKEHRTSINKEKEMAKPSIDIIIDSSPSHEQLQPQPPPPPPPPPLTNSSTTDNVEYVSACLLVMDDNHFLIEWLAYHYHVLPLRYLIVAVDPRSQTSPTPIFDRYRRHAALLNLTIVEWHDEDYMTHSVDRYIIKRPDDQHNVVLLQHRARQRMFFYRCLQTLQEHHHRHNHGHHSSSSAWTLLADTDEYVVLNQHVIQAKYNQTRARTDTTATTTTSISVPTMQEPGSVLRMLKLEQQQQSVSNSPTTTDRNDIVEEEGGEDKEGDDEDEETDSTISSNLTTTTKSTDPVPPCFQIPRLRFGIRESPLALQYRDIPPRFFVPSSSSTSSSSFNASHLLTLRWRYHAKRGNTRLNKISKSLIDLTRIPKRAIQPVTSVHRPIRAYCTQRRLHRSNRDSVLVIHHYLGTWEQYNFRKDAREGEFMRGADVYRKATKAQALENDDARPWLKGFVESVGEAVAKELLKDVGYVPPKRNESLTSAASKTITQTRGNLPQQAHAVGTSPTSSSSLEEKCAFLFFGLPRAYQTLVLPSIIQNVLWPNAKYNCDVFVHYFYVTNEPEGRKNKGGAIDPEAIRLLEPAVHAVAQNYSSSLAPADRPSRLPYVDFIYDTEEAFWMERNHTIQKYRNTKDKNGKYLYFPWAAKSYLYPSSLDNIVRQWHSIESVWELMERAMRQGIANYTHIAVLRSDVLFATPFDIYRTSWQTTEEDVNRNGGPERYAVTPPFGLMPVNDRLIYGPYAAIKIWATKRFDYIDYHVRHYPEPGYGMHSERFLEASIFIAMVNQTGVEIVNNPDICFFRTRADGSAMISDCGMGGKARSIVDVDKAALVKSITGLTKCEKYGMGKYFSALRCSKG